MTKLLGVIGDPISHSLSPLIHNGWLRDLGYNATYEAMHVPDGAFAAALEILSRRDTLGVNVTLPHKAAALAASSEFGSAAGKIGAANTLTYLGDSNWRADNTDALGFVSALGPIDQTGEHVLVLGAGGSARAIMFALADLGCQATILNRTVEKAERLATEFNSGRTAHGSIDQYQEYIQDASIVVNTTSIGYDGSFFKLPNGGDRLFFDISYGKIAKAQIDHASDCGWRVKDGLTMLVAQAAYSFEMWFGEFPDQDKAIDRCEIALKAVS